MSKLLPNNTEEANDKVTELLMPVLEYLTTLNDDKGKIGFFSEEIPFHFRSATISIKIHSNDQSDDVRLKSLSK